MVKIHQNREENGRFSAYGFALIISDLTFLIITSIFTMNINR